MRGRWLFAAVALAWAWLADPALAAGNAWFEAGRKAAREASAEPADSGRARNVILFLGDGMALTTVTAARILEGQRRGEGGEENLLSFERFPYTALSKVYTTDAPDARVRGHHDRDRDGRQDALACPVGRRDRAARRFRGGRPGTSSPPSSSRRKQRGLATGDRHHHRASRTPRPAATYAHTPERDWENDSRCPRSARGRLPGHRAPADRVPHGERASRSCWAAAARTSGRARRPTPSIPIQKGARLDGRDLIEEWLARAPRSVYVWNREQFDAVDPAATDRLLGLFEPGSHAVRDRPPARRRGRALALADDGQGDRDPRAPSRRLLPDGGGRPHRPRPSPRQRLPGADRDDRALERGAGGAGEDRPEADADRGDGRSRPRLHDGRLLEARQRHPRQGGANPRSTRAATGKPARRRDRAGPTRRSVTRTAPATRAPRPSSRKAPSTSRTADAATAA